MFANLLKQKWEIEESVNKLHSQYIALRQQSIIGDNSTNDQKDCVNDSLKTKIDILKKIKQQYSEFCQLSEELRGEIKEASETVKAVEQETDWIAECLNIKFPEELKRQRVEKTVKSVPQIQKAAEYQENDNNIEQNKSLVEEEEKDNLSDKENSENNLEYFSPNLQIRKSFVTDESKLYTPAIKSQTKSKKNLLYK